ncbi:MAG TPA: diguanylate cyclase [Rhodanobacteraceae bacterium]
MVVGVLLACWPLLAWSANAALTVTALAVAPNLASVQVARPSGRPGTTAPVWLRMPLHHTRWYALRLTQNWHRASPPLLSIYGNVRGRVTVYMPPDYRPRSATVYSAGLDPTFSRDAVVYRLPPDLAAGQPIYLQVGNPGQGMPVRVGVTDEASYRAADLWRVRANTFFAGVQLSMLLVVLCFWAALRERVFLYFVAYILTQALYGLAASGELYTLPGAVLLAPLGYHTTLCIASLVPAFLAWFTVRFAELRAHTPLLARSVNGLGWFFLALAIAVWLPFLHPDVWLAVTGDAGLLAGALVASVAAWLAWRRGSRSAGSFLLAWVPLLALTVVRAVQLLADLPLPTWLEYAFPASMAYASVLITVGLADRTRQTRRERDRATRLAQFDSLTGALSRRAIRECLQVAWHATVAVPDRLAVLFLDIDHFKQINDTHGHAAGDACLRALTDAIRAELRGHDLVGRYGGEEFLVVLQGDAARVAGRVAEHIVARAAALRVRVADTTIALTVSVGAAARDAATASAEALVESADTAQYRAKAGGRNQAVVWQREAAPGVLACSGTR